MTSFLLNILHDALKIIITMNRRPTRRETRELPALSSCSNNEILPACVLFCDAAESFISLHSHPRCDVGCTSVAVIGRGGLTI